MMVALYGRTMGMTVHVFAFPDRTGRKELATVRIKAFNAVGFVTTEINLHPNVTIGAIEVVIAFLFATDALTTAIHLLIVSITFCMNTVMTVALRFRINALYRRWRRWRRRRSYTFRFFLFLIDINRQCHC
jgi:hypothetical protein